MLSRLGRYEKYAFGITDKFSEGYWTIAILLGIAFVSVMCFVNPSKWVAWLIVTPFVAWAAPIMLLMIMAGIEGVIFCFIHPKEVFTRKLFKSVLRLLYIGIIFLISLLLADIASEIFTKEDSSGWKAVYVSESINATKYHYSEECKTLKRSSSLVDGTLEEVERYGYLPCKVCLKSERKARASDNSFLWFVGFSVIFFYVGNCCYKVSKRYKIQSPIVKKPNYE